MFNRPLLGELLMELGATGPSEAALERQQTRGGRIGDLLVEEGAVEPADVARALAMQLDAEYADHIDVDEIDINLLDEVPISYARSRRMFPLRREAGAVVVACVDPLDTFGLDQLARTFREEVEPIVVAPQTLVDALNLAYDKHDREKGGFNEVFKDEEEQEEVVDRRARRPPRRGRRQEAPVIQFVNTTSVRAARDRARYPHRALDDGVRFRIDGVLRVVTECLCASTRRRGPREDHVRPTRREAPAGRIRIKLAGKDIDMRRHRAHRVERVTMRLLDKTAVMLDLAAIGMDTRTLERVEELIRKPYGIILVTGPTGSGKTTLYLPVADQRPDLNILTCEDPVEYQLKGISQIAVNPKINLTFMSGLRSFLRHDPDVIMVGEIRTRRRPRSPSKRRSRPPCLRRSTRMTPRVRSRASSTWAWSPSSSRSLLANMAQRPFVACARPAALPPFRRRACPA